MTPTTPGPGDDGIDPGLEGEIREALRRRDPGRAPLALRERALDVPERTPRPRAADTRRNLSVVLGWPRTVRVAIPFHLVEPEGPGDCPASGPPSPSGVPSRSAP